MSEIYNQLRPVAAAFDTKISEQNERLNDLKSEKADMTDLLKAFPTDSAQGAIASFTDGANVAVKSLVVNIDPVQEGSGDPSPDNIRPISGWSEVNVQRTGKNLLDDSNIRDISDWESLGNSRYQKILNIKKGVTYTISGHHTVPSGSPYVYLQQMINDEWVMIKEFGQDTNNFLPWTFTPTSDKLRLWAYGYDVSIKTIDWMQIELGSIATPYDPYSGQSINIALGQTVYGGALDVTKGELVIDRAGVDFGTLNWTKSTRNQNLFSCTKLSDMKVYLNTAVADWMSSNYKITSGNAMETTDKSIAMLNTSSIYVNDSAYTDATAEQFKTAMSGVMLVYPLATPLTIQLTPHEVTALLGSNNVWADSGDSTVEYRADPTLYIQRLTEPDADMVADANITSGQYFMVGNTLYKATANIASGATISPNVNCTRKSLSEALNELNA